MPTLPNQSATSVAESREQPTNTKPHSARSQAQGKDLDNLGIMGAAGLTDIYSLGLATVLL